MNCSDVKKDLRVRTTVLGDTRGFIIDMLYCTCRRSGITGTVSGVAPGHGGEVWFVRHDGCDEVGAYCFDEFEAVEEPKTSKENTDKARIGLDVPLSLKQRVDALQAAEGIPTTAELFRRMVSLGEVVQEHRASGGKIVLEHQDGTREVLRLL